MNKQSLLPLLLFGKELSKWQNIHIRLYLHPQKRVDTLLIFQIWKDVSLKEMI